MPLEVPRAPLRGSMPSSSARARRPKAYRSSAWARRAPAEQSHELATQPLAQRMFLDERLEFAHELAGGARAGAVRLLDPLLQAGEARFLEAGDLALGPLLIGEVGERRLAPQGEARGASPPRRGRHRLRAPRVRRPTALEAVEVELPGRQVQEVTGRAGLDRAGAGAVGRHGPAQLGDVHLHGLACGRQGDSPELGDQPLGRDDLVRPQQQERQQGPLAEPSERDGPIAVEDLERPQDPECRGHDSAANVPRRTRIRVAVRGRLPQCPFLRPVCGACLAPLWPEGGSVGRVNPNGRHVMRMEQEDRPGVGRALRRRPARRRTATAQETDPFAACRAAETPTGIERSLCYRSAANLANEQIPPAPVTRPIVIDGDGVHLDRRRRRVRRGRRPRAAQRGNGRGRALAAAGALTPRREPKSSRPVAPSGRCRSVACAAAWSALGRPRTPRRGWRQPSPPVRANPLQRAAVGEAAERSESAAKRRSPRQ